MNNEINSQVISHCSFLSKYSYSVFVVCHCSWSGQGSLQKAWIIHCTSAGCWQLWGVILQKESMHKRMDLLTGIEIKWKTICYLKSMYSDYENICLYKMVYIIVSEEITFKDCLPMVLSSLLIYIHVYCGESAMATMLILYKQSMVTSSTGGECFVYSVFSPFKTHVSSQF